MQIILEIVTFWALSIAALGLIVVVIWRWSGTALPPAAVVDKKFILPPEFLLFGIEPEAWRPEDSLEWRVLMAVRIGRNWHTRRSGTHRRPSGPGEVT